MHPIYAAPGTQAAPIWFATPKDYGSVRASLSPVARAFADAARFEPKPGRHLLVPDGDGALAVLVGLEPPEGPKDQFQAGRLPALLPDGTYRFAAGPHDRRLAALAFALGCYRFDRYRKVTAPGAKLELPDGVDGDDLSRIVEAVFLARDLINTPSNDMGPAELADAATSLAGRHGAACRVVEGDELAREFPLIHAVGRAAARAPRLVDFTWGYPGAPKITLVGKGVCFDTGGLDIKPPTGMLNMKKDMGGAANVLALAHMVMDRGLKLRLRVLVPSVENAISGDAFRPLDVYRSRKGLTVEIGNTDAEGRLILADALALADEEAPDLVVDMATLTGAARVALGPDLPALFTNDDGVAGELADAGLRENDPVWRLPLWQPYDGLLNSKIADLNNVSSGPHAGSITAALFLQRFVSAAKSWVHLDVFSWNATAKPGRPEGGECQAARALYALLCQRYA